MSQPTPENPQVIFEQENPYGTLAASLESDGRTIFLYLHPIHESSFQPRAVWVRNLTEAPEDTDREAMQSGMAPRFKKEACAHPAGKETIQAENVELLWFQEGNSVALYVAGRLEAIIPPWSGKEGYFGYAVEALAEDVGTLPFPTPGSGLFERVEENRLFWEKRKEPSYWDNFRDSLLAHYESVFGPHTQYYAVTGRSYPPLAVVEFKRAPDDVIYATLGMSYQNMPQVELYFNEPQKHMRAEIITRREEAPEWMPGLLGRIGYFPWSENTFFTHGHSYESGLTEELSDFIFSSIYDESLIPVPAPYTWEEGLPVNFLYALPVEQEILLESRSVGSGRALERILKEKGLV